MIKRFLKRPPDPQYFHPTMVQKVTEVEYTSNRSTQMELYLYLNEPGKENVYALLDHLQNVEGVISAEPCPRGYIDDPGIIFD